MVASNLAFFDRSTGEARSITSHGEQVWPIAIDPTGTIVVTGVPGSGVIQVGSADGTDPHLLYGHSSGVNVIAISPDSRWIASGDEDGEIRIWPMPDVTGPPIHTMPHAELVATLKRQTNLRVVRDEGSSDEWKVEIAPFPGWKEVPTWWPTRRATPP